MSLKILFVAAEETEAEALRKMKNTLLIPEGLLSQGYEAAILVTGMGGIATAWALTKWFSSNQAPDIAINVGIAGSYRDDIKIGDVVLPVSDLFADAGVETRKGFVTLNEEGMGDFNKFPFTDGKILAENSFIELAKKTIRPVNAITVNTITGSFGSIEVIRQRFNPDIETMEGASFFYVCSRERIPFMAVRSISNMVEPRDKRNWNIGLALERLTLKLEEFLSDPGL